MNVRSAEGGMGEGQVREGQQSLEKHDGGMVNLLSFWCGCRNASSLLLSFVVTSVKDVPSHLDEAHGYTSDRDILKSRVLGEGPEKEVAARRCVVSTWLP
jgi:hypothetical protein